MNLWLPAAVSAASVCGLLWAETRGRYALSWLFKPAAAACFIWLAWLAGATESGYGRWLLPGLACCWLGDVLLIPRDKRFFLAGLASFLTGHLLYCVAFLQLAPRGAPVLAALPPALALAWFSWRWLRPHLPADMRLAVAAYIAVISGMLLSAASAWHHPAGLWIALGACGFAVSDLAVARQQFVQAAPANRLWGTPLYFAAQMLLAYTPALV